MTQEDGVQPWDRQPGETSKAYQAFQTYLDLGSERSVRRVAEELSKSGALIAGWSGRWDWPRRAEAWDSLPRRAVATAYEEMAREIAEDHRRVATKLLRRLETGMDQLPEGKTPTQTWTMAHGAARQGHQFATDLSRPKNTTKEEITKQIGALVSRLLDDGDDE